MSRAGQSEPVKPMPGIPAEVACPWCGGYVRGHQWIGTDSCSVSKVFDEPVRGVIALVHVA